MSVGDVILLIIRWLHAVAAVAWVGGGLFYLLILQPAQRRSQNLPDPQIGREFHGLVTTAMGVLLVTGVILTFDRLTSGSIGITYVVTLIVKILLGAYMFYLVAILRRRTYPDDQLQDAEGPRRWNAALSSPTTVVVLGVIVFLLSDILRALFEYVLKG